MELAKYAHACVTLTKGDGQLVVDPGAFTPNAKELIAASVAILITHEHFDHFDQQAITAALEARPDLHVYGPSSVIDLWNAFGSQVHAVSDGDTFELAGFEIAVFGEHHARIHQDIPLVTNVGFLFDNNLYHPGDAYHVPPTQVQTLLLPTSGPWAKLGEAVDYIRAVNPKRLLQIHEIMLSETGQNSTAMFLSPKMLSSVALEIIPIGDTVTV